MNTSDLDAIEARYATAACEVGDSDAWRSAIDVPDLVAHIRALHAAVRELAAADAVFRSGETVIGADVRRIENAIAAVVALVPEVTT